MSPAGLVTLTFTSPEIFFFALKVDDIKCVRYANNFCFHIYSNKTIQMVT